MLSVRLYGGGDVYCLAFNAVCDLVRSNCRESVSVLPDHQHGARVCCVLSRIKRTMRLFVTTRVRAVVVVATIARGLQLLPRTGLAC